MQEVYLHFQKLVKTDKLSHLYLIDASKILDIKNVIYNIVQILNQVNDKTFIFKEIDFNDLYPNIFYFDIKKAVHKKEELRNFFSSTNIASVLENQKKIIIVENIEFASNEALNAILKEIEEPSKNTCILLITKNPKSLLATIISRAQYIKLKEDEYADIIKNFDINETNEFTPVAIKFAYNSLDLAKEFNSKKYQDLFKQYTDLMKALITKKHNYFPQFYIAINDDLNKEDMNRTMFILSFIKMCILGLNNRNNFFIKNEFFEKISEINSLILKYPKIFIWVKHINEFLNNLSLNASFKIQKSVMLLKLGEIYE
ncbi:DNA polymerase III subunit [Mycoplasmopsis cynos]|uniref:DNA polymerase III subunit n=2 Tax=Mycoplasmopsis cynos TaxID=171284 RepID=L0RV65_MYCC1|nr:DNA polymerase III subunit [Mycoplasmopsis cynos]MCU9935200.1 DNA polymerase III subunit delta [Mycoplasmopsis cynos]TQC55040.1 DNA polymerase III subunit delta [Mycoplasmopsis cynos]UWV80598.1 DNA polymerase III subunit delta [Mycoplasmopsis cynos]WAM05291.1 DNA polymerase III subunit delta [Mycoplasmopsis cynos]WQQ15127.1 DNA polymerase III subunit delta [Mycoplasmopsis cynos]